VFCAPVHVAVGQVVLAVQVPLLHVLSPPVSQALYPFGLCVHVPVLSVAQLSAVLVQWYVPSQSCLR